MGWGGEGELMTLYELMEQTAEHIEEKPGNYYQDDYACSVEDAVSWGDMKVQGEPCGTAYCRAGWMASIAANRVVDSDDHIYNATSKALMRAGIPELEIEHLFDGGVVKGTPGTKSYAKAGAKGVRAFMKKHETKLKATELDEKKFKRELKVIYEY